jgi:predicted metal-dependent peptidase
MKSLDGSRVAAARLWAATRFPYLASALFATRMLAASRPGVAAIDEHWNLYLDPALLDRWTTPQLGSLLVHHVGHLLRDHADRARHVGVSTNHGSRWQRAADAEINDDLTGAGLQFPMTVVTPESLDQVPHRFAEEYFGSIVVDDDDESDCGSGADGQSRDFERPGGLNRAQRHLLRCQVDSEVLKHASGVQPGSLPDSLRRWAEDLLGARVDWRNVLRAEIRRGLASIGGMVDYSYTRPSRRASAVEDVILPGFIRPVPEIAVVVDTSGSMHEQLLGEAMAEVDGLFRALGGARQRLRVISCDAAVLGVQRVSSARQVELLGGGGTNMAEGIRAAVELKPRPTLLLVLTDGFTPWPAEAPRGVQVVIGLLRDEGTPPPTWARTVLIQSDAA